jgi:hypothetical protein
VKGRQASVWSEQAQLIVSNKGSGYTLRISRTYGHFWSSIHHTFFQLRFVYRYRPAVHQLARNRNTPRPHISTRDRPAFEVSDDAGAFVPDAEGLEVVAGDPVWV